MKQFVTCLPVEVHRRIINKKPATLAETAKLADEFVILYKPFATRASYLMTTNKHGKHLGFLVSRFAIIELLGTRRMYLREQI